jgi:predicted nucleic acid-binding protein
MNSVFIDTNILVYAFDTDAGDKHARAQSLLRKCWENQSGTLSTQVLQEFYVTVTHKLAKKVDRQSARNIVQTYKAWPYHRITAEDIIEASELEKQYKLSFWDALIVISAQRTGATALYSEDMQHEQQIGNVKIINPFK